MPLRMTRPCKSLVPAAGSRNASLMPFPVSLKREPIPLRFPNGLPMLDVLYLLGTAAFFALMLGYVNFCERLASPEDAGATNTEKRA